LLKVFCRRRRPARRFASTRQPARAIAPLPEILYSFFMPKFEKHIFICGNQRPPGHPRGCCDPNAQAELQKLFKQKLAERGLKGRVRANQAGCLDQCEHGPNLVVYPDAVWYGAVTPADVDEIIESHIIGGKPVERLVLADSCLNTANCEHKPRNTASEEPESPRIP
jgi:(2Fe-2S) ferredoxin